MNSSVALGTRLAASTRLASLARNWRWLTSGGKLAAQGDDLGTTKPDSDVATSETVAGDASKEGKEDLEDLEEPEMVEMWNKEGPAGPEWNGPRGYEPTRHGDWSRNGRVSDF